MRNGTKFKRFLFWLIEYFSAKRSAVTIACSEGEYKEAMKLSKRSTYVNNGINTKNLKSFVRSISKIQHPIKYVPVDGFSIRKIPNFLMK